MVEDEGGQLCELELLAERIDPIARDVLDADDSWSAYEAANAYSGAWVDDMVWMPHGGDLYRAWALLTDLYETGLTPIPDAHAALRNAAAEWLGTQGLRTKDDVESWLQRASRASRLLFDRDGDWWNPPA